MIKTKFRIGDIVFYKNDFSYNPACDVMSVGRIEGIHIHRGKGLFADSNDVGKILYSISGVGLIMPEDKLYDNDFICS